MQKFAVRREVAQSWRGYSGAFRNRYIVFHPIPLRGTNRGQIPDPANCRRTHNAGHPENFPRLANCGRTWGTCRQLTTSDHHSKKYLCPFFQWSVQSLLAGNVSSINQQSHHIPLSVWRQYLPGKIQSVALLEDMQQLSSRIRRIAQLHRHSRAELFPEYADTFYRNHHGIDLHAKPSNVP